MLLLTNDDGIDAPGFADLVRAVAGMDELFLAAPARNRSGIGHAITLDAPVRVTERTPPDGAARALAIEGTPADAVKFALKRGCAARPRLVLSGVNPGPNLGVNVLYSGTVGAATEAVLQGVSSLAVSVEHSRPTPPETLRRCIRRALDFALGLAARRLAAGGRPFCLNLNIPALPPESLRGIRWTRHGRSGFDEDFLPWPGGAPDEFKVRGEMVVRENDPSFDAAAMEAGWASLTPLKTDWTDTELLSQQLLDGAVMGL